MKVQGTGREWFQWTGVDFQNVVHEDTIRSGDNYMEVSIPGGLVPVQYFFEQDLGIYVEPSIWVCHELAQGSLCQC